MKKNINKKSIILLLIVIVLIITGSALYYFYTKAYTPNVSTNVITVKQVNSPIVFKIDADTLDYEIQTDQSNSSFETSILINEKSDSANRITLTFTKYDTKNPSCITGGCGGLETDTYDQSKILQLNTLDGIEIGRIFNAKEFKDNPDETDQILVGKLISTQKNNYFVAQEVETKEFDKATFSYNFSKNFNSENPDPDTQKLIDQFDDVIRSMKLNDEFFNKTN